MPGQCSCFSDLESAQAIYDKYGSCEEVGKVIGKKRSYVNNRFAKLGVKFKKRTPIRTDTCPYETKDELFRAYDTLGTAGIARKHGVTKGTALRWLRSRGKKTAPRGGNNNPYGVGGVMQRTIDQIDKTKKAWKCPYKNGAELLYDIRRQGIAGTARKNGVGTQTIYRWMDNFDLPRRRVKDAK